ncbi:MAG: hypothetical protein ACLS27_04125 [Eubacterium sp.]
MTQIFDEAGNAVPVTVVEAGPCNYPKKTMENDITKQFRLVSAM